MNQGRPFASADLHQPDIETAHPSGETEEEAPIVPVDQRPDRLKNALLFSPNYEQHPQVKGQAKVYPDTVKTVDERYMTFDTTDEKSMDQYSEILRSHDEDDQYKFTSGEALQWDEKNSRWLILARVRTRMFKTLINTRTDPTQP